MSNVYLHFSVSYLPFCDILLLRRIKMKENKNRIRKLRKAKGLTLKELSEELKKNGTPLSASSLIKYERGERAPKLETWINLADYFEVSVDYLRGVSNETMKHYGETHIGYTSDNQLKKALSERTNLAIQASKKFDIDISGLTDFQKRAFLKSIETYVEFLKKQIKNNGIEVVASVSGLIEQINTSFSFYEEQLIDNKEYNERVNNIVKQIDNIK